MRWFWKKRTGHILIMLGIVAGLAMGWGSPVWAAEGIMQPGDQKMRPKTPRIAAVDTVRAFYGAPGVCGQKLSGEGEWVQVIGFIDKDNIFDRLHYPQLPYEKFLLTNRARTSTLEVWVEGEHSGRVFADIWDHMRQGKNVVVVGGILRGIDMPVMGPCKRDVQMVLHRDGWLSWE